MRSAAELMRAYYEALNEPNLDALEGLFHPDAEWRFPGSTLHGGAPVRLVMRRSLSTGLRMHHVIGHMVEQANVALCELVATNVVDGNVYTIRGAVVCEEREGKIIRLAAYPDAGEMTAFLNALEAALAARA